MLTKQKNSPYWYAVIYNGGNRRKWVSTMTRSKAEAKIFHDELKARYKRLRTENKRCELLGLNADINEPVLITDILSKYKVVRGEPSGVTLKNFNRFVKWLKKHYPKVLDTRQVTKKIALEYLDTYNNAAPKTYNNNRGSLRIKYSLKR